MLRARLAALFGAAVRHPTPAPLDVDGLQALEQEIRDTASCLRDATRQVIGLMARELQDRRALEGVDRRIAAREGLVREARDRGDDVQAIALAKAIAAARHERDRHLRNLKAGSRRLAALQSQIDVADGRIADLSRQLAATNARAVAYRAEATTARHTGGARLALAAAEEILAHIRTMHDGTDRLAPAR
jgi:phage shock protein A